MEDRVLTNKVPEFETRTQLQIFSRGGGEAREREKTKKQREQKARKEEARVEETYSQEERGAEKRARTEKCDTKTEAGGEV